MRILRLPRSTDALIPQTHGICVPILLDASMRDLEDSGMEFGIAKQCESNKAIPHMLSTKAESRFIALTSLEL